MLLCSQSQQFLPQISNSAHQSWGSWRGVRGTFARVELHPLQMKYTFPQWCWVAFVLCVNSYEREPLPQKFQGQILQRACLEVALKSTQSIPCQHTRQQPLRPDVLSMFWMRRWLDDPFPCPVSCPFISEDEFWWEALSLFYSDGFEFYKL